MGFRGIAFWVISLIPLVIGIGFVLFGSITSKTFGHVCKIHNISLPATGLVPGLLIIFIIIFGWVAIYTEARILGFTFLTVIFALSVSMFIFLILGSVYKHKAGDYATECVGSAVNEYRDSSYNRNIINIIQDKFECCGVLKPEDWKDLNLTIPETCCKRAVRVTGCSSDPDKLNNQGCIYSLQKAFIASVPYLLALVGLLAISLLILGIAFASSMGNQSQYAYQQI